MTGALCFVEADWPLIGGAFTTRDVHVLWPKRLAKLLTEPSDGTVDVVARTAPLPRTSRLPSAKVRRAPVMTGPGCWVTCP